MKINKNNVIIFVFSCINIFFAIPFAILNIHLQKNKKSYLLLSILIAGLGWFFTPSNDDYDIARYYNSFFNEQKLKEFIAYHRDFYVEYLIRFLKYLHLNFRFLAFISAFITYYFVFKCLEKINKKSYLTAFYLIYIILAIPIIGYTGIRFAPAVSVAIYGLIIRKNLIWLILASCFHSGCLVIIIVYFVAKIIKVDFGKKKSRLLFIIVFFTEKFLTIENWLQIIKFINSLNLVYITPNYILGKWGIGYLNSRETLISKIVNITIIELGMLILIFYCFFIYYKRKDNFILFFILLIVLFKKFFIFYERYIYILLTYMTLKEIIYFSYKKTKKRIDSNLIVLIMILILNIIKLLYDIKRYYPSFILSYFEIYKINFISIFLNIF